MRNSIREVAEKADIVAIIKKYGGVTFHGRMFSCPFHGDDKHPSAGLRRNNRWGCFACSAGGDSVDFVSKILNVTPLNAAKIINEDFGLGVNMGSISDAERKAKNLEKMQREEREKKTHKKWRELTNLHLAYSYAIVHFAPKTPLDLDNPDPRYVKAVKDIDRVAYELNNLSMSQFPSTATV